MSTNKGNIEEISPAWSLVKKVAFRVAFIYFFLLAVPLDWKYWRQLFSLDWTHFQSLFVVTAYSPQFIPAAKWGIASYANWALILLLAIPGAGLWSYLDRKRKHYNGLYYWLRVILRYRLAVGIAGYGVLMLFGLLFPSPTQSDLATNYGEFLPWKIYYLSLGAAKAHYQQTLGAIELVAAALLLYRRTAVVGAGLITAALLNVVLASFAYQLGDHVYASSLLLIAFFLFAHDLPKLYALLVRERLAKADTFELVFATPQIRTARVLLKVATVVFIAVYAAGAHAGNHGRELLFPSAPGLSNASGYYNVKDFEVNGQPLAYSLQDPVRWQNVVFEQWNTLSVRVNRPVAINLETPFANFQHAGQYDYESSGNGGRHFYSYKIDKTNGTIDLTGKNDPGEHLTFHYANLADGDLLLTGSDKTGNALRIVLNKIDKKYLLLEGRRKPLTIY